MVKLLLKEYELNQPGNRKFGKTSNLQACFALIKDEAHPEARG
jgi:hypothetical protein